MVTPAEVINNFKTTPFDLWGIRKERQQFEIIEDVPPSKKIRTGKVTNDFNGQKVAKDMNLIRVRVGIFEKDLAITDRELTKIAMLIPESEQKNWKGAVFAFDNNDLVYICTNHGDNTPATTQSAPITQNQAQANPNDQRDIYAATLVAKITAVNDLGTDVFMSDVLKLASKISPGNEVSLVGYTKTKGLISEADGGVIKVNKVN